jgi:hypothetical protein
MLQPALYKTWSASTTPAKTTVPGFGVIMAQATELLADLKQRANGM